jgi:hypothetical protein
LDPPDGSLPVRTQWQELKEVPSDRAFMIVARCASKTGGRLVS